MQDVSQVLSTVRLSMCCEFRAGFYAAQIVGRQKAIHVEKFLLSTYTLQLPAFALQNVTDRADAQSKTSLDSQWLGRNILHIRDHTDPRQRLWSTSTPADAPAPTPWTRCSIPFLVELQPLAIRHPAGYTRDFPVPGPKRVNAREGPAALQIPPRTGSTMPHRRPCPSSSCRRQRLQPLRSSSGAR